MKHWKLVFFGLLTIHILFFIKTQFTAWPEMLFWPYLMLKGWLPYRDIGIAHSPALILILTFFYKIFGLGIWQQKIISWFIPLLTDGLLLYFFSKLFGTKKSLIALAFYILFQVYYDGNGIWFDHALVLFSLMIFYFLEKKNIFFVGIFWALALLTKQTAVWFLLPTIYYFVINKKKKFFIINFFTGTFLVSIIFVISLFIFGLQKDFLNWTILFGITKLSRQTNQIRWPELRTLVASLTPFLILVPLFFSKNKKFVPLLLWVIAGSLGTIPRFELFHFQPALPFLALGFSLTKINRPTTLFVLVMTLCLLFRGLYRKVDKPDRFYEVSDIKMAQLVKKNVSPEQIIFVTNYWDNLYPLTNTIPATRPFIPQLPQYINQPGVEDSIVQDLIQNRPKIVIRGQFSPGSIYRFEKINDFIDNNYQQTENYEGVEILKQK